MLKVYGAVDRLCGQRKLLGWRSRGPGKCCWLSVELGKRLEVLELVMWEPVWKLLEEFLSKRMCKPCDCPEISWSDGPEGTSMACRETQEQRRKCPSSLYLAIYQYPQPHDPPLFALLFSSSIRIKNMELTCGEALKSSEPAEFECEGVRGVIPMKW